MTIVTSGEPAASAAARQVIRAGTRLGPVPLVPEIRLHQATEPIGLWQRTEHLPGGAGREPPFWGFAWAGGQALARYVLDHPHVARGRHVIDIASGSGLAAIAAAMAGAAAVTAYDIDPLAAAAVEVNAAANGVTVLAVCADVLDEDGMPACRADLVLVADAFYQLDLAAGIMRVLRRAQARGAAAFIGDFGRAYLPRRQLTPLASYDVPGLRALEDSDSKRTTIWALSGRPAEAARRPAQPAWNLQPGVDSRGPQAPAGRPGTAASAWRRCRGDEVSTGMDVMVLARDAEESFAAIGPVSDPEAAEQIRKQIEDRGWTYLGTAPVIAAGEFRQPSQEAGL